MKSTWVACVLGLFGGLVVACGSHTTTYVSAAPGAADGGVHPNKPAPDPDDPANQPPHSLGSIILGETHASGAGGTPAPIVSAIFVPDALKARACKKKLDGAAACEIIERAK